MDETKGTMTVESAKQMQALRQSENKISHEKRMQVLSETLVQKMTDLIGKEGTESRVDKLWELYQKINAPTEQQNFSVTAPKSQKHKP